MCKIIVGNPDSSKCAWRDFNEYCLFEHKLMAEWPNPESAELSNQGYFVVVRNVVKWNQSLIFSFCNLNTAKLWSFLGINDDACLKYSKPGNFPFFSCWKSRSWLCVHHNVLQQATSQPILFCTEWNETYKCIFMWTANWIR